jgi:hypothetical protein
VGWPRGRGYAPRQSTTFCLLQRKSSIFTVEESSSCSTLASCVRAIIEAFRQQRRLRPIRPHNEALHQVDWWDRLHIVKQIGRTVRVNFPTLALIDTGGPQIPGKFLSPRA